MSGQSANMSRSEVISRIRSVELTNKNIKSPMSGAEPEMRNKNIHSPKPTKK